MNEMTRRARLVGNGVEALYGFELSGSCKGRARRAKAQIDPSFVFPLHYDQWREILTANMIGLPVSRSVTEITLFMTFVCRDLISFLDSEF